MRQSTHANIKSIKISLSPRRKLRRIVYQLQIIFPLKRYGTVSKIKLHVYNLDLCGSRRVPVAPHPNITRKCPF